jgi:hypothetical protein
VTSDVSVFQLPRRARVEFPSLHAIDIVLRHGEDPELQQSRSFVRSFGRQQSGLQSSQTARCWRAQSPFTIVPSVRRRIDVYAATARQKSIKPAATWADHRLIKYAWLSTFIDEVANRRPAPSDECRSSSSSNRRPV